MSKAFRHTQIETNNKNLCEKQSFRCYDAEIGLGINEIMH